MILFINNEKTIFAILILIVVNSNLLAQSHSNCHEKILQKSNNIHIRQIIVDSLVNESFWDRDVDKSLKMYLFYLKKDDFSEKSKQKLMQYFNRKLTDEMKSEVIQEFTNFIDADSINLKENALKNNMTFEDYKKQFLIQNIPVKLKGATNKIRREIPIVYSRILGWLDYKDAIPLLKSVLSDSIKNENYAIHERDEFVMNCKLALARMGNEEYENEIIELSKSIKIKETGYRAYLDFLFNLYYINSQKSISAAINMMKKEDIYTEYYPELSSEFNYINKNIILTSLYYIIKNYPLQIANEYDMVEFNVCNKHIIFRCSYSDFYSKQFYKLEKWLENNKDNYELNTETFFY
jgi:hypothetical protein